MSMHMLVYIYLAMHVNFYVLYILVCACAHVRLHVLC